MLSYFNICCLITHKIFILINNTSIYNISIKAQYENIEVYSHLCPVGGAKSLASSKQTETQILSESEFLKKTCWQLAVEWWFTVENTYIFLCLYRMVLILCVKTTDVWIWCKVISQGRRRLSLCELCPCKWSTIRIGWTSRGTDWSWWVKESVALLPPQYEFPRRSLFHVLQSKGAHFQLIFSVGDQLIDLTETNNVFHLVYLYMYVHIFIYYQVCATRMIGSALSAPWLKKEYKSKNPFLNSAFNRSLKSFFLHRLPWSSAP